MRNIKTFIIILLCLLSLLVRGQTVSVTFYKISQQKVYLNAYTGLYMEVLDSVMMDREGRVEFNTPLKKGMYQIETESGIVLDFLFDNEPVSFIIQDPDNLNSIQFVHSEINTDWYKYRVIKERTMNLQALLKPILQNYDKNMEYYIATKHEYERLQNDFKGFTDNLLNKHDNYATTLIRVDRPQIINLDDDLKKQYNNIIANYFNDVDFNDVTLIPTNVLTTKVIDFLSLQQTSDKTDEQQRFAIILGIDHVLNLASVNYQMYKFLFQYLIEGFGELGFDEVVDYMTRLPYLEDIQTTDEQYDELISIAESNSRVKIGDKARNIKGTTVFNDEFDLYSIDNEFIILYFWSYSCPYCREIFHEMKQFLDDHDNYTLVSVIVKGELKKIKNLIKREKLNGYFYYDGLGWNSPVVNDYAVSATPSIFILDKDKKIVKKPFDIDELIEFAK